MDINNIRRLVLDPARMGLESSSSFPLAQFACQDLAYSTFALTDFGRASEGPFLYTDDAIQWIDGEVLDRPARLERYRKREANTARKTRHVITNYLFRLIDESSACAMYLLQVYLEDRSERPGATPLVVADCGDFYLRQSDGSWRINFRHLESIAGRAH